jgi:urate oxidase
MAVAFGKIDQAFTDGKANSKVVSIDSEGNITDFNDDGRKSPRPPPLEVIYCHFVKPYKHLFDFCDLLDDKHQ